MYKFIKIRIEDIDKGRNDEVKEDNWHDATNYPDDKSRTPSKNGKVAPEGVKADRVEEEEENLKTEEDDSKFLK